jgi:hypothetical protein
MRRPSQLSRAASAVSGASIVEQQPMSSSARIIRVGIPNGTGSQSLRLYRSGDTCTCARADASIRKLHASQLAVSQPESSKSSVPTVCHVRCRCLLKTIADLQSEVGPGANRPPAPEASVFGLG